MVVVAVLVVIVAIAITIINRGRKEKTRNCCFRFSLSENKVNNHVFY